MKNQEKLVFNYVDEDSLRLDSFIVAKLPKEFSSFSRSLIAQSIKNGFCRVNNNVCKKTSYALSKGDLVEILLQEPTTDLVPDSSVCFDILYEDQQVIVVNKPAGLVVHPAPGVRESTLVHGVLAKLAEDLVSDSQGDDLPRPGIVHRLDKGTSGVMVVAKTLLAKSSLQEQLQAPREMKRVYHALVSGKFKSSIYFKSKNASQKIQGVMRAPIGRNLNNRTRYKVDTEGRAAGTSIREIASAGKFLLLECELETGRTHQIRVHLEALNLPIVGDVVYRGQRSEDSVCSAAKELGLDSVRPMLHAKNLSFIHPASKKRVSFEAPYPEDFGLALKNTGIF